jgi:hypothetical protein
MDKNKLYIPYQMNEYDRGGIEKGNSILVEMPTGYSFGRNGNPTKSEYEKILREKLGVCVCDDWLVAYEMLGMAD